jgi:hypothetical protein
VGGETGNSIMLFEETAPAGADTTFHLHHDSNEVAYVLSDEISFKIGDELTVGDPTLASSCHPRPKRTEKSPASKPAACCSTTPRSRPALF